MGFGSKLAEPAVGRTCTVLGIHRRRSRSLLRAASSGWCSAAMPPGHRRSDHQCCCRQGLSARTRNPHPGADAALPAGQASGSRPLYGDSIRGRETSASPTVARFLVEQRMHMRLQPRRGRGTRQLEPERTRANSSGRRRDLNRNPNQESEFEPCRCVALAICSPST